MAQQGDSMTGDAPEENEHIKHDTGLLSTNSRSPNDLGVKTVKRRTKTGCLTCRKRRIKCGEERPICENCLKSKRACLGYSQTVFHKRSARMATETIANPDASPNTKMYTQSSWNGTLNATGVGTEIASVDMTQTSKNGLEWTRVPIEDVRMSQDASMSSAGLLDTSSGDPDSTESSDPSFDCCPPTQVNAKVLTRHNETDHAPGLLSSSLHTSQVNKPRPLQANDVLYRPTNPAAFSGFINDDWSDRNPSELPEIVSDPTTLIVSRPLDDELMSDADWARGERELDDCWDVQLPHRWSPGQESSDQSSSKGSNTIYTGSPGSEPTRDVGSKVTALVYAQSHCLNSPLLDERSQHIFEHYMLAFAPCMGTFDRRGITTNANWPRTFWTDDVPAMTFTCHALAHAVLAVSAMHMFKVNLGSENVAIKHFTYALKRVGRKLANPEQRLETSTLAAVLLLGIYEIMAGDHSRWSLHLSGAGKLVMEHNYAAMIRTVRDIRSTIGQDHEPLWMTEDSSSQRQSLHAADTLATLLLRDDWRVDQDLISQLMGLEVDYDIQSQCDLVSDPPSPELDRQRLSDLRSLMDLYWWYCRQDVFMSMISGDRPLLPYPQWKYCPPRGPLGNGEMPHATVDHLWLILGRLVDFGGKDLKRKKEVADVRAGRSMSGPASNESTSSATTSALPSGHQKTAQSNNEFSGALKTHGSRPENTTPMLVDPLPQLDFFGMMPLANGSVKMSSSFDAMAAGLKSLQTPSTEPESDQQCDNLETQTHLALQEHAAIVQAFDLFESSLGPNFQPLPVGDIQINTPFGPAIQYKSPIIAAMWTFFLAGRIMLRRLHPHSPPAAMISTGVNAHLTYDHAQTIGRIYGGLFAKYKFLVQEGHADCTLAGAVVETTFSLLFAAVQYQDPVQRDWIINSLNQIAQITGWQTTAAIIAACEATWERAGLAGRGFPYERKLDRNHPDDRVNGKHRFGRSHMASTESINLVNEHGSCLISHDRNLIDKYASTRAHWALGLLSVDEDLQRMSLSDRK